MSKFNTTNTAKTTNICGHTAYKMGDELTLTTMVLTTLIGEPKFYGDNTKKLIELAKKVNPEYLAQLAIFARKEFHLRSVSHLLAAIVANRVESKKFISSVVAGVVERADDVTEILACYLNMYGKPIPNGLKRSLAKAMNSFNEYQIAKYNGGSKAVKFRDVLKLTHAKPKDKYHDTLFNKIITDTLETPYTWEVELSTKGNTKEVWEELIDSGKLGYMAQLRNLKNMLQANPSNLQKVFDNLENAEAVAKSKQLPFRYYSAVKRLQAAGLASSKVVSVLDNALEHSVANLPKLPGKTLIAVDVSGSMGWMISGKSETTCAGIACLIGAMASKLCEDCVVQTFDTQLKDFILSPRGSILEQADRMNFSGGGTNIALPIIVALGSKAYYDRIIILSDNEINCGFKHTCQSLVDKYRKDVNENLWVHAIDLQGYGTQQFIGSKTNIIAGWSERVLEFIDLAERGVGSIVDKVKEVKV